MRVNFRNPVRDPDVHAVSVYMQPLFAVVDIERHGVDQLASYSVRMNFDSGGGLCHLVFTEGSSDQPNARVFGTAFERMEMGRIYSGRYLAEIACDALRKLVLNS